MAVLLAVAASVGPGIGEAEAQLPKPPLFYTDESVQGAGTVAPAGTVPVSGIYYNDGSILVTVDQEALHAADPRTNNIKLYNIVHYQVVTSQATLTIYNYTQSSDGNTVTFLIPKDLADTLLVGGDLDATDFTVYASATVADITRNGKQTFIKSINRDGLRYEHYKKFSSFDSPAIIRDLRGNIIVGHPTEGNITSSITSTLTLQTTVSHVMKEKLPVVPLAPVPEFYRVDDPGTPCAIQSDNFRMGATGLYRLDGTLRLEVTGHGSINEDEFPVTHYVVSGPNAHLEFYNYTLTDEMVSLEISAEAVGIMSDDPVKELTLSAGSKARSLKLVGEITKFIQAPGKEEITHESYKTFTSFNKDALLIEKEGVIIVNPDDGDITHKHDSGADQNELPTRTQLLKLNSCRLLQIAPDIEREQLPASKGDDDWWKNPTFGRTWADNVQLVTQGFSFNGRTFDVTDNYHVDFERTTSQIGTQNTVTVKAYAVERLDTVRLSLGVPEISRATDAESDILVRVQTNYESPAGYDIVDISHDQEEDLVDPAATTVSVQKVKCNEKQDIECHEFTIGFRIMAPLMSDVLAVSAMDIDRRVTTTYINDGVSFEGEPLLPAETATLQFKRGNQHPAETVRLEQQDRRYNLWSDQDGHVWMRNSYGSWIQMTFADFERLQDPHVNVMTRTHSSFADLVDHEREKARQVFDAESIKSVAGESFSRDAPVRIEKLQDPEILEKLRIAELAALEYLKSYG